MNDSWKPLSRSDEERPRERRAVAEAAEQRALADAGLGRDRVHRRAAHAVLGEQLLGRREDAPAVARGVRPLGRVVADDREFLEVHEGAHHS